MGGVGEITRKSMDLPRGLIDMAARVGRSLRLRRGTRRDLPVKEGVW